jgi:phosphopantetheinyl transferase
MRPAPRGTNRPLRQEHAGTRSGDALSAAWKAPPERLVLGAAETHVWAFEAGSPAAREAGRRSVLAAYAGLPPESLRFTRSEFGKPELATPGACPGLRISFSTSAGLALVALRRDFALGVDLEAARELPVGLARRAMTATERQAFEAMPPGDRAVRFLALWVAKEAVTKAAGCGLRQPFDAFDVADPVCLPRECGSYRVMPLPAPRAGYAAAIASTSPFEGVRLWSAYFSRGAISAASAATNVSSRMLR